MLSAKPRGFPTCSTPSFVGGYVFGFQGTNSETSVSLTSLTGGLASAPAEDDIVIVFYATGSASADLDMYVTGYTEAFENYHSSGGSGSINYGVWWKKMTATPDTSITVSQSANSAVPGAVVVHVWRGQDLTSPFCITPVSVNHPGVNDTPDPPLVYAPYRGAVILCAGATYHAGLCTYTASYLSNFVQRTVLDVSGISVGLGSVVAGGGNYNPAAWSQSGYNEFYPSSATLVLKGA